MHGRAGAVAGIAAIAILGVLALAGAAGAHAEDAGLTDPAALESRGPITIRGNEDFTAANGVRYGSGTPEDPFVIENWTISGTGLAGISISDVAVRFFVQNVRISANESADFTDGIRLSNVTGASMVDAVEVVGQERFGIYVESSTGVRVCNSVTDRNGFIGVYAHVSHDMIWLGNAAHGNDRHGFYLANGSSQNRITQSHAQGHTNWGEHSYGIYTGLGANDNVFDNNSLLENGAGIQVNQVTGNVFRDNDVIGNLYRGISVTQSEDSLVESNYVERNAERGILVADSHRVEVRGNDVQGNEKGVELTAGGDHVLTRNRVRNNSIGIYVTYNVGGSLVYDNLFSNSQNARDDAGTLEWNVTRREGPNIVGEPWVGGNYWSDLPEDLHDHDNDGLGEAHGPYAIGIVRGGDYLPIMTQNTGPHASFSFTPSAPETRDVVTFTDNSTARGTAIVNRSWTLGDGTRAFGSVVEHAYAKAGRYHVVLEVKDEEGLTSRSTETVVVRNRPPIAAVAGGPVLVSQNATVLLDASPSVDEDGRIVQYDWEFEHGPGESGVRVERTFSEGTHSVSLLVVDDAGASDHAAVRVTVDATPPVSAARLDGARGTADWFVTRVIVTLNAHDAHAGIERVEWRRVGEDAWREYATPLVLAEGVHGIEHRAVDAAGHVEDAHELVVRVDATPAATRFVSRPEVGPGDRVALEATDATSGVVRTLYSVPWDEGWREYVAPFRVPADVADGNATLLARSVDAAGNVEETRTFLIQWDTTAPVVAFESPKRVSVVAGDSAADAPPWLRDEVSEDAVVVVGEARVRVTALDGGTGVALVRLLVDGEVLAESSAGALPEIAWRPERPGVFVLRVEAEDAVGNSAATELKVVGVFTPDVMERLNRTLDPALPRSRHS